jgi:hypothetical protein
VAVAFVIPKAHSVVLQRLRKNSFNTQKLENFIFKESDQSKVDSDNGKEERVRLSFALPSAAGGRAAS